MPEYTVVVYKRVTAASDDHALTSAIQDYSRGLGVDGRIVVKYGPRMLGEWSPKHGRRKNVNPRAEALRKRLTEQDA